MKKIIYIISVVLLGWAAFTACTDSDSKYVISTPADGQFKLAASDTILNLSAEDGSVHTAVTFSWDSLTYGISTPVTYTLQIDTLNGSFGKPYEIEAGTNVYALSFTDSVLNKKLQTQLKLTAGQSSTIKVRLKAALGFGNNAIYSSVRKLSVSTYSTEKQADLLYMPGANGGDWSDFSVALCSRNSDGTYEGFVNAAQWTNFKFTNQKDMNGVVYGSTPNSLYSLDSGSDKWNIWFEEGGYFLVKANLNTMTWSKTAITSICITGDFNGWSLTANPMTYNSTTKVWTANCNINTIGWGIQIIVNGDWSFKYGDTNSDGSLLLGGNNIVPASTGTKTITVDLSNPEKYTYKIQ